MRIDERALRPIDAADWFAHRSYAYEQFSDLRELGRKKAERGLTVSAVLPGRNVADTVGEIVGEIHAVNERAGETPLVDQILVVDADSPDGTADVAAAAGAEVFSENELMRDHGGAHGKGDAMWRSLTVARGDLVMFMDADTKDFKPQLVYGILGPILDVPADTLRQGRLPAAVQEPRDRRRSTAAAGSRSSRPSRSSTCSTRS